MPGLEDGVKTTCKKKHFYREGRGDDLGTTSLSTRSAEVERGGKVQQTVGV